MASVMRSKGNNERAEELDRKYESVIKKRREQEADFLRKYGMALDVSALVNTEATLASDGTRKAVARRLGILRLVAEIMPRNASVRETMGDVLFASGDTISVGEARSEYVAALERTDAEDKQGTRRISGKLGLVYARLGRNSEAEKFFAKALDPAVPASQLPLMAFYLTTDQNLSEVKTRARSILEQVPAEQEDKERLAPIKKEAATIMVKVLVREDGTEQAQEFLEEYLKEQPQEADILLTLAGQLRNDMAFDDTTTWLLERYAELRKELPISLVPNLAEVYLRQERYDALVKMRAPVIAGPNTDLARFYYFVGLGYEALGEAANAAESYEKALSLLPEDYGNLGVVVANNLSWLYFKSGEREKAQRIIEEAVARDPANTLIWDTYGWIIYKTGGDLDKAFELIEGSHLANPEEGIIAYHYAKLLMKKGLTKAAIPVLQRAIESGIEGKEELEDAQQILKNRRPESGKGDSDA